VSVTVPLDHLPTAIAGRPFAYVVTVSDAGRAHVLAVDVVARDGVLVMDVGRSTLQNVATSPQLTLVLPPITGREDAADDHDAYSLVVDGTGGEVDGRLVVQPTGAVLHRPAPPFTG
jgi:hypothetical protein